MYNIPITIPINIIALGTVFLGFLTLSTSPPILSIPPKINIAKTKNPNAENTLS